jgi:hypothetical protein
MYKYFLFVLTVHYIMNGIQYILLSKSEIINKNKNHDASLLNNKKIFIESMKKNNHFKYPTQKSSWKDTMSQVAVNLWHYVYQQIFINIGEYILNVFLFRN